MMDKKETNCSQLKGNYKQLKKYLKMHFKLH